MTLDNTKKAFVQLGDFLEKFTLSIEQSTPLTSPYQNELAELLEILPHHNAWFTKDNLLSSLKAWSKCLTEKQLFKWLSGYTFTSQNAKTVAIVMAGNIPLVGFHDFLCVLLSGHKVHAKLSSNDQLILPFLTKVLVAFEPGLENRISFTKERLEHFDAVIATGSNNTARYFEYYFKNKPHIIRKNRNSVAILTGNETNEELALLADDIFAYFGLGCRSVSKIYVPVGYDFGDFFKAMFNYKDLINHVKYANNYDYNKAVYLMSKIKLLDNGFLVIKEDENFGSPIACVFYEYYQSEEALQQLLQQKRDQIQCVVTKTPNPAKFYEVGFGQAQSPQLWDYADGVDTLEFLSRV